MARILRRCFLLVIALCIPWLAVCSKGGRLHSEQHSSIIAANGLAYTSGPRHEAEHELHNQTGVGGLDQYHAVAGGLAGPSGRHWNSSSILGTHDDFNELRQSVKHSWKFAVSNLHHEVKNELHGQTGFAGHDQNHAMAGGLAASSGSHATDLTKQRGGNTMSTLGLRSFDLPSVREMLILVLIALTCLACLIGMLWGPLSGGEPSVLGSFGPPQSEESQIRTEGAGLASSSRERVSKASRKHKSRTRTQSGSRGPQQSEASHISTEEAGLASSSSPSHKYMFRSRTLQSEESHISIEGQMGASKSMPVCYSYPDSSSSTESDSADDTPAGYDTHGYDTPAGSQIDTVDTPSGSNPAAKAVKM